jgi:hypothetical protein
MAVFPFHIRPVHGEEFSVESGNLQVVRHGLEEEFVCSFVLQDKKVAFDGLL